MAGYKKIRDLAVFNSISKDHLVPVSTPLGDALESTGSTTAQNFFGAVISNSSTFELDSDGNLKIKPGAIKAEDIGPGAVSADNLAPGATTTVTSETMVDVNGVQQTISSGDGGFIAVRVSDDGSGGEQGPNPRTISHQSVITGTITEADHGLQTGQKAIFTGDIPPEINLGQEYTVTKIDNNQFSIDGITAYTTTNGKEFTLSRGAFVAFDAQDYKSNNNPHFVACVNFEFSSFAQAFRWFVRYGQGCSKIILLVGKQGSHVAQWSDSPAGTAANAAFNIGGGRNFEYLTQMQIWGCTVNSTGSKTTGYDGAVSDGDGNAIAALASLTRARLAVKCNTTSDNLPIWFRIFGSVYIENVTFDYMVATGNTVSLATGMRCSHGLFSLINVGLVIWCSDTTDSSWNTSGFFGNVNPNNWMGTNNGNTAGTVALEGGQIYYLGGVGSQWGFSSIGVNSSIGPSKHIIGTPNTISMQIFERSNIAGGVVQNKSASTINKTFRNIISQTLTANSVIFNDGTNQTSGYGDAQFAGTVGTF
jgi:hypothetical protein